MPILSANRFFATPHGGSTRIFLCLLLCGSCLTQAHAGSPQDIEVHVSINDETVIVDSKFRVAATPQEAWAVMMDFEHMTDFISSLESSKVLWRSGSKVHIEQKGKAAHGFFSFAFEAVRELQLTPFETIESHLLSGNLKKFDAITHLSGDATGTWIVSHAESIPDIWLPPFIGASIIKGDVCDQLQEMHNEIMRRKQVATERESTVVRK